MDGWVGERETYLGEEVGEHRARDPNPGGEVGGHPPQHLLGEPRPGFAFLLGWVGGWVG